MNPARSTNTGTALDWLNLIQRGGTEDWKRVYEHCRDPQVALEVASALRMRDPDLIASARLWKFLIEDLHPDIHVELDERRREIGV
jgi:hypothetical protein